MSPWDIACERGHLDTIKLFLERVPDLRIDQGEEGVFSFFSFSFFSSLFDFSLLAETYFCDLSKQTKKGKSGFEKGNFGTKFRHDYFIDGKRCFMQFWKSSLSFFSF